MKKNSYILILIIVLLFSTGYASANSTDIQSAIANSHHPYFPGELLIKFKVGVSQKAASSIHSQLGISEVREGFKGWYQIITVVIGKEKELARSYLKRVEVEYAEPNYYRSFNSIPNDEFYHLQWNFPLINLPDAWDLSTGSGVTVAVVDSGVNPFGFDSFGRFSENRILPGHNAIWRLPGGIDFNGHGTHVAGTIGQETNNTEGVAGIAYHAKILPVKVMSFLGFGLDSWIIRGIRWAADNGADIINLSIGGGGYSKALEDAVDYAYEKGVTLVAASGNDGTDEVDYPAAFENCIAVGAIRYDKEKTDYSNYGEDLDLVAPGGDLTVDQNGDDNGDGIYQETFRFLGIGWDYRYFTGTSMASPHVAGVAALIKSLHPEYGPDEIRQVLQDTAEDLGNPGWDERYGYGLVDAYAAVSY
ncbi:MAG: S8 family serine peptidase [Deltaproteobacteria bacterium]|nr:S8 family serine peptidase [Deltaproteobacteria bacterium]